MLVMDRDQTLRKQVPQKEGLSQHPPNYPLRYPIYQLIETIRPSIKLHWGSRRGKSNLFHVLVL